jgi:hypothetical protein
MDEKRLTERKNLFKREGWEVDLERHFPDGGCVVSVYVKRPKDSKWLLLGEYPEAADAKSAASAEK